MNSAENHRRAVRDGLRALDVRRLVFGIHDASFPGDDEGDTGRGSPCSPAGAGLLRFVHDLGFDGVQLGPQGQIAELDPSPYAGAIFSRNTLSISLLRLARDPEWLGLLPREHLAAMTEKAPAGAAERVPHGQVFRAHREALGIAYTAFRGQLERAGAPAARLSERFETFKRDNASWLERDALYEAVRCEHTPEWQGGSADDLDGRLWQPNPSEAASCGQRRRQLRAIYAPLLELYRFGQFVAHAQHRHLRAGARTLDLRLYGDLQIGLSDRDVWSRRSLMLPGYHLGAPPSRTNPEGQPWGYPVLDPNRYLENGRPGPVLRFFTARMYKMFSEYDALRIDHPHGFVCPWVYRSDAPDPVRAAQEGARLFCSPDLPDHPVLAPLAIVERRQLDPNPLTPRHADTWVRELTPGQVERYGLLMQVVVDVLRRHGRGPADLACEVLSTQPYPLQRVLQRYGLGRFRVTQKADMNDPNDVYRAENAAPEDWIMLGNHDTPPVWNLLEDWERTGHLTQRARYLAERLEPEAPHRVTFAERLAREPGLLAQAELANLFASPARHVMIFFTDLFGFREDYNRPGTISQDNWSLRLPRDYRKTYAASRAHNRALNLPLALGMALRARRAQRTGDGEDLLRRLDVAARSSQ